MSQNTSILGNEKHGNNIKDIQEKQQESYVFSLRLVACILDETTKCIENKIKKFTYGN